MVSNNFDPISSKCGMHDTGMGESAADSVNISPTSSATVATSSGAATRDSSPDLQGELGFERDQTVSFLQHGLQAYEQGFQAVSYALELLKQLPQGVNITPDFIARAQQAEAYRQQLDIANTEIKRLKQEELVLASAVESQAEIIDTRNAQIDTLRARNADLRQTNERLSDENSCLSKKLDATDRRSQGQRQQLQEETRTNARLNDAISKIETERDNANGNLKFLKQELKTAQDEIKDRKAAIRAEQSLNSMLKDENRWLNKELDQLNRVEKKAQKYYHFFLDTIDIERSARKHAKRRAAGIGRSPLSTTYRQYVESGQLIRKIPQDLSTWPWVEKKGASSIEWLHQARAQLNDKVAFTVPEPLIYVPPVAPAVTPPVAVPVLPTVLAPYDDSIDAEGDTDEEDFSDLCITTPYYAYAPVNTAMSALDSSNGSIVETAPVDISDGQQPIPDSAVPDTASTDAFPLDSASPDGIAGVNDSVDSTPRLSFIFDFDCIDPTLLSATPPRDVIVDSIEAESHAIDETSIQDPVSNKMRKRKSPSIEPIANKRQRLDDQEEHCHGDRTSSVAPSVDNNKTESPVLDGIEAEVPVATRKRKSSSPEPAATKRQRIGASPADSLTTSSSPTIAMIDTVEMQMATSINTVPHIRSESPSSTSRQDIPRRRTRSQPPISTPVRRSERTRKTPRLTGQ